MGVEQLTQPGVIISIIILVFMCGFMRWLKHEEEADNRLGNTKVSKTDKKENELYKQKIAEIINIIKNNIEKSKTRDYYEGITDCDCTVWEKATVSMYKSGHYIIGYLYIRKNVLCLTCINVSKRKWFSRGIALTEADIGDDWCHLNKLYVDRYHLFKDTITEQKKNFRKIDIVKSIT